MGRPDEKQPGFVPCIHCGEYEARVACPGCRFLACGPCALSGCPEEEGAPIAPRPASRQPDGLSIDPVARALHCDGESARFEDVIEVTAEAEQFAGWGDLHYEYRVRIVLGDRQKDFLPVRIRSHNPMPDLDALVTARGDAIARALGVKLRIERG
ncbi:MAG: hypothetical protein EXR72_08575 [Myxococcales bacterium]|nr:hypothetical protein [Myxococcales bacterium]